MEPNLQLKPEKAPDLSPKAAFDLRENWLHLKMRPAFQEPVIDGVRAIAILWVMSLHMIFYQIPIFPIETAAMAKNPGSGLIANGTQGVDLFFVISGFLMGSILFSEVQKSGRIAFPKFYVRRFLRLIPVYLVAMVLALYLTHGLPGHPKWDHAENIWANLLYVNNFLPRAKQYMGWCWSLAIEEQFYLLLPFCILAFVGLGKARFRVLATLMCLSVAIRFAVVHFSAIVPPYTFVPESKEYYAWYDTIYDKPWMRFGGLLAGVSGAYLSVFRKPQLVRFFSQTRIVTLLCVGCIGVIAHIAFTGMESTFFDQIPYLARELWWAFHRDVLSIAVMFIILSAIHTPRLFGGWLRRFLSWKAFYPIAQLSYSFYLVHEMLFQWLFPRLAPLVVSHIGPHATMALDALVGLTIASVLAVVLYVTIERPSMRLRSHPAVLRLISILSHAKPSGDAPRDEQPGAAHA
jgi:peptidoglycan/LPS O-acetylase OafA/YrhL